MESHRKAKILSKKEIQYYRAMWDRHNIRKSGRFIIEGIRAVDELLNAQDKSDYPVQEVLIDPVIIEKPAGKRIVVLAQRKNVPIEPVKRNQLIRITETRTPQGIIAVVALPAGEDDARLDEFLQFSGTILYLDGVQDPGNCGTLIRSAAAFGASGVVIGEGTAKLYNSKVIRATASAFLHIPIIDLGHRQGSEIVEKFAKTGFEIFITASDGESIKKISKLGRALLIIGNEGAGIRQSIIEIADRKISIPISLGVESLNAAVAGSIILFEFQKLSRNEKR